MSRRFLGLDFKAVDLGARSELQPFLRRFPQKMSGYTFATIVAWAPSHGFEWTRVNEDLVLIGRPYGPQNHFNLLQPIGHLDSTVLSKIESAARDLTYPLQLLGLGKDFLAANQALLGNFTANPDRDASNYLYSAAELAELRGRKFSKKRNLIAQFLDHYPGWDISKLDAGCKGDCVDVLLAMARGDNIERTSSSLQAELNALEFTMRHFVELEQNGIMIRHQGSPVAFSIFEPLNSEEIAVHFEKADRHFKGSFQVINQETAKAIVAMGYKTINREEDMGNEGLRQAKASYHPKEIYSVYNLTFNVEAKSVDRAS